MEKKRGNMDSNREINKKRAREIYTKMEKKGGNRYTEMIKK